MTVIEARRLVVDGINTSVLVGGAGQPGEAVVFVHGNPDAGSDWMPLMTRIAELATIVAPDLPGFGAADKRPDLDYTVGGYARFLDGVINQLGIDRVHLVAHDFGGPFAATWAADHPDRVASVTFVNTGVLIGYRWHRMARVWRTPVIGKLMMRLTTPKVARFVIGHDNPGLPQEWVDTIAPPHGDRVAGAEIARARPRRTGGVRRCRRLYPGRAGRAPVAAVPARRDPHPARRRALELARAGRPGCRICSTVPASARRQFRDIQQPTCTRRLK